MKLIVNINKAGNILAHVAREDNPARPLCGVSINEVQEGGYDEPNCGRCVALMQREIKSGDEVMFGAMRALFLGMARQDCDYLAVIRVNGAQNLLVVHPSKIGITEWCHYCGSTKPYRDDLWEGQDWPRCPDCESC